MARLLLHYGAFTVYVIDHVLSLHPVKTGVHRLYQLTVTKIFKT